MNTQITNHPSRELYLTPYVEWFLQKCGFTEKARLLNEDICRAMDGSDKNDGFIRLSSATTFLLFILDPSYNGGPERVFVWSGPSDGHSFESSGILNRAVLCGTNLT